MHEHAPDVWEMGEKGSSGTCGSTDLTDVIGQTSDEKIMEGR